MIREYLKKFRGSPSGAAMQELGVAGAKISNRFVFEEFLPELRYEKGRRTYREMQDNDAIISSILFAIRMILRSVDWSVEENSDSKGSQQAEDGAIFAEGVLFDDMAHTWEDFISEVLSMLTFGWQYTEIVYKRRVGPYEADSKRRSNFTDGRIGIRKLANRAQETLDRWDIDEHGGVNGMWQQPPLGGAVRYIPIEKALLFRPEIAKGSPEGRSALRGAYRSWYMNKNIEEIEAIAIERELNGLPVVYIPSEVLTGTSPALIESRRKYIEMVRDVKLNSQAGVALPSDVYYDADGNPTNIRQVELQLLSSTGSRSIDASSTITRYQQNMARTVLADFIMLGSGDTGSWALSKDKSSLFNQALSGWVNSIAAVCNRYLIPRLWRINDFDRQYQPYLRPGRIAPVNLDELGKFISEISTAGAPLFPDENLENELRDAADLPERSEDAMPSEDDVTTNNTPGSEGTANEGEMDEA